MKNVRARYSQFSQLNRLMKAHGIIKKGGKHIHGEKEGGGEA